MVSMKSIFLKNFIKTVITIIIIFSFSEVSSSQTADINSDKNIIGSLVIIGGIKRGILYENVFSGSKKVSELEWQLHNCWYTGISTEFTIMRKIALQADFAYGFNDETGSMSDSDWETTGERYSYSSHSCEMDKALFVSINSGWIFKPTANIGLIPFLGFDAYSIGVSAHNGYIQLYSPYPTDQYGMVVLYRQKCIVPELGFMVDYEFYDVKLLLMTSYGRWGIARAIDNHYKTDVDYYDSINNIQKLEVGAVIDYNFSEKYFIRAKSSFTYIPSVRGSGYSVDTATGKKNKYGYGAIGIQISMLDIGLGTGIRF